MKKVLIAVMLGLVGVAAQAAVVTVDLPRPDGQPPARNTASTSEIISLAGDWRFEIAGENTQQCPEALTKQIHLPGTIDDARLGPPNPKAPTLEGPWRLSNYAGPAWYQREIEIPENWSGKRVTLLLERCRWVTTVWLDDKRIGSENSLIAPHVHDLGTSLLDYVASDKFAPRHELSLEVLKNLLITE